MRNNILLTLVVAPLLSGLITAIAAQTPEPGANTQKSVQERDKADRGAGSQTEGQPSGRPRAHSGDRAFGTITSVGVDRFEIKRKDGTAQTVMADDQTRYWEGPEDARKELHLEELKPGNHVFVQGRTNDNKEFVALMVRRMTNEEIQRFSGERAVGEIIAIEGNQVKVRNPRQGEKTIVVNEQTVFMKESQPITLKDLKAGDRIFALGKETDGQFVAARIFTGQFRRDALQRGEGQPRPEDH